MGFAFGLIPLVAIMLFSLHRVTPYLLPIPVVAAVQFVFTLAFAYLVAAGNVFFRDLGNVLRHLLRLVVLPVAGRPLQPRDPRRGQPAGPVPFLRTLLELNLFAILFEAYRALIWGIPATGLPGLPIWSSLALLAVGSVIFLALATIVFKRLEPRFAKVL